MILKKIKSKNKKLYKEKIKIILLLNSNSYNKLKKLIL